MAGQPPTTFRPLTEALPTDGMSTARTTWSLLGETGPIVTRAAFQTSQDGITWNANESLSPTSLNNDGWKYNTTWESLNISAADRYIRFGVRVARSGGNTTQAMGQCVLRVDVRGS